MTLAKATLFSSIRARLNDNAFTDTCTEAMDATETGLDVADTTKYDVGDVVEFQDDGEQCLVTVLNTATELTVRRGVNGTTGATHSISATIKKNPRFSYFQMEQAVSETIQELWPNVYKPISYSITPVAGTRWYEIDSGGDAALLREVSTVRQVVANGSLNEQFQYGERRSAYPAVFYSNVATSIAGSTKALYIPNLRSTVNVITVIGLAPVTDTVATAAYSDLDAGIPGQCVTAYAVSKLIAWTGITRVTQEDVSMSDESVRPGVRESIAQDWERRGYMFRRRWEMELQATYPRRTSKAGARSWDGV